MIRKSLTLTAVLIWAAFLFAQSSGGNHSSGSSASVTLTNAAKTANYTAVTGDFSSPAGIAFKCTAVCQLTLPSTAPTSGGYITVQNESYWPLVINPNGNQLEGLQWTRPLAGHSGLIVRSDGTNYHIIGGYEGPDQTVYRHTWRGMPNDSANNYIWDSFGANTTVCPTFTENAPTLTKPIEMICATTASTSSIARTFVNQGDEMVGNATKPSNLEFKAWLALDTASPTSSRFWVGFFSCNGQPSATSQFGSDNLSFASEGCSPAGGAAFRLSTAASDATWKCITSNGTTQTVTSTGLTLDTSYHLFEVRLDDVNGKALFMVDGAEVCFTGGTSATMPTVAAQPFGGFGVETLTTAVAKIHASTASVSSWQ